MRFTPWTLALTAAGFTAFAYALLLYVIVLARRKLKQHRELREALRQAHLSLLHLVTGRTVMWQGKPCRAQIAWPMGLPTDVTPAEFYTQLETAIALMERTNPSRMRAEIILGGHL